MGVILQQSGGGGAGGTTVNTIAKVSHLFLDSFTAATGLFTASQPAFTDISGSVAASQLPNPSATTLGGIQSLAAAGSKWINAISTSGVPSATQPAFSDLSGSIAAGQIASGLLTWEKLGSALGNLSLSNADFTTTFNQTSAVVWLWINTTVASAITTNASPLLELAANYWTGAASAADTWTIGSSLAAGTNGKSIISIAHTGSTGLASVQVPGNNGLNGPTLQFSGTNNTGLGGISGQLILYGNNNAAGNVTLSGYFWTGSVYGICGQLVFNATSGVATGISLSVSANINTTQSIIITGAGGTGTGPAVALGGNGGANSKDFSATSGTQVAIDLCGNGAAQGRVTHNPASGNAAFIAARIQPTINVTGTASGGSYTALKVAVTETSLTGMSGNKLLDLLAGSAGTTELFSVDNAGNETSYTANGAQWVRGSSSELLTLSTVGLTTDTVGNLLPANSIIEAVVLRVTTALTTTTSWGVGDATTSTRFAPQLATLALGTTVVGLTHVDQTGAAGPKQTAAAKVRITCVGSNPGAGVVRITVFYRQFVAPTS